MYLKYSRIVRTIACVLSVSFLFALLSGCSGSVSKSPYYIDPPKKNTIECADFSDSDLQIMDDYFRYFLDWYNAIDLNEEYTLDEIMDQTLKEKQEALSSIAKRDLSADERMAFSPIALPYMSLLAIQAQMLKEAESKGDIDYKMIIPEEDWSDLHDSLVETLKNFYPGYSS